MMTGLEGQMVNPRVNFRQLLLAGMAGLLLFASACSSDSTAPPVAAVDEQDQALVRVVQAMPGDQAVDVLADDRVVFQDLDYKTVTMYQELPDDRFTFRVRPTGQAASQPLAENSEGLSSGNHYTIVALNKPDGGADLMVFGDDLTPPSNGKAKVRVIQAAPDVEEVDVYAVGRDTLFRGIDAGSESSYADVDPMEVTLQVRPAGEQNSLLNIDNVQFEAGKVYTIVIAGRASGSPNLEAIRIEDQLVGTPTAAVR
jgi:hypothetical protein